MSIKNKIISLFCTFSVCFLCVSSQNFEQIDTNGTDISRIKGTAAKSVSRTFRNESEEAFSPVSYDSDTPDLSYTPQYSENIGNNKYYYLNGENINILKNNVTISPVEAYTYLDGPDYKTVLCVHCRIYNGYDYDVSDISVDCIQIFCSNKKIAYIHGGECQDLTLKPHQSTIWTFYFDNCSIDFDTDLSTLECVSYAHADVHKPDDVLADEAALNEHLIPDAQCAYKTNEYTTDDNVVDICPTKIYYKNDKLVVCCNIYNGHNYEIQELKLNWGNLYSAGELIAQGNVGTILEDKIKPGENASCEFEFGVDSIVKYNARIIDPYFFYYYSYSYS